MAREWQQTRFREIVMPDCVYYQTLWAVRDLGRMEERLAVLNLTPRQRADMVAEGKAPYYAGKTDKNVHYEKQILRTRITAIRQALGTVPAEYQPAVMTSICERTSHPPFTNKAWKVWKQRFLFRVAKNLSLI